MRGQWGKDVLTPVTLRIILRNMTTTTKKKITLMLDAEVYESIKDKVGARKIGAYLSDLARPHVVEDDLEAGYKAMAADEEREKEAQEWIEGTHEPIDAENNWNFK